MAIYLIVTGILGLR
ncbi:hypothetical protein [Methylococcus sp. EFPC2]